MHRTKGFLPYIYEYLDKRVPRMIEAGLAELFGNQMQRLEQVNADITAARSELQKAVMQLFAARHGATQETGAGKAEPANFKPAA